MLKNFRFQDRYSGLKIFIIKEKKYFIIGIILKFSCSIINNRLSNRVKYYYYV